MHLTQWFEEFRDDVRFAIRQLRRAPAFTFVAALTLALGVGANSAMFALADATLLRPLPFPHSDRLVFIEERGPRESGRSRVELLNLQDWVEQNRTLEALAAFWIPASGGGPTLIAANGTPETLSSMTVTAGFFDLLGVTPIAGRTFLPSDETELPSAVVLSEGIWRRRFAGDPTLVGQSITLDGRPSTVVGIVPASFQFAPGLAFLSGVSIPNVGVWALLPQPRQAGAGNTRGQCGNCRFLQAAGRLKSGVSIEQARSDLTAIAERLALRNGDTQRPRRVSVTPLREVLIGRDVRLTAILFLGVVGFLLLLCCANVANLVLARTTARTKELAVRSALGAGRRRIVAQLLTESLSLAILGGALGMAVGAAIVAVAPALVPPGLLPPSAPFAFDGRVVTFCAATTLAVGVLFGVAPALQVTGPALMQAVGSESRTATGRTGRFRSALVAAEIAVAVLVLCGAGLLLRTLLVLERFEPGYHAASDTLLTVDFSVPPSRYPNGESLLQFYDAVEREVAALPGVRNAAWATTLPSGNSQIGYRTFSVVGDASAGDGSQPSADYQIVSPDYFQAMDLPIVAGRPFTGRDRNDNVPVCIVNEAFVSRHMKGRNPIGMRLSIGTGVSAVVREIVGVARQVKDRPDELEDLVQLYVPNAQDPWPETYLVVRTVDGLSDTLTPAIRTAVARVDNLLPVRNIVTLETVARDATARYRFRAVLVMTFAGLALLLAMVGVFGVLAYSVQQRVREFGVRIALGATTTHVLTLVLGNAARVTAAGAAIGLVLAAVASRSISSFLFGVQPFDPLTYVSVAIVLAVTAAVATAAPALRATRVDPAVTFRGE
jgi:putative ABC transport system permease protein